MGWDFFQFKDIAKEGGSESRARRPPLHSSQRARLENSGAYVWLLLREMTGVTGYKNIKNKGLTSHCYAAIIWYSMVHIEILQFKLSIWDTKHYIITA